MLPREINSCDKRRSFSQHIAHFSFIHILDTYKERHQDDEEFERFKSVPLFVCVRERERAIQRAAPFVPKSKQLSRLPEKRFPLVETTSLPFDLDCRRL